METQSGLEPQFNTHDQQKCFIAYTHKAPWSEDIIAACTEVLPRFGLEAWYADDQFEPGRSLKDKVVEMIANARYGIFDLSAMYDNERKEWVMPRNVLIELGIAIALNCPVLLLRAKENRVRGCPLPTCLKGLNDIIEFSGEPTLKRALEERIPQWMNVSPEQMWWTRSCLFGNRVCEYREVHPRMERWQQEGLHCHIGDGPDPDCVDFRCLIEDEMSRYSDLTFAYLDARKPPHPYHFVQCAHCQMVRSSQFAIYRVTPQTDAETYMAIGMSIALESQFGYEIPKIFFTADVRDVPSLLSGYEVIEAVNTKGRKQRLRKALPVVMQRVQECAWNPRVLPFEALVPLESGAAAYEYTLGETLQEAEGKNDQTTDWKITMKPDFTSALNNMLPVKEVHQVMAKIQELVQDPKPDGKVKKQVTSTKHIDLRLYRIRSGEYRIFYTFEYPFISLLALRRRDENTYEDLPGSYFGLQLEPSRRRVWVDGSPLSGSLSIRQFDLLQFLAARAGKVCLREETSRAVYGERYIQHRDDARLDALIERTRLLIGDDQGHPRFIETVRGVGHRLNNYIGERS